MAGSHQRIAITCLHLVALFVPILGQIIATIMLIADHLSPVSRVLWLAIIWLFPFLGPLLYTFFSQQLRRKMIVGPGPGGANSRVAGMFSGNHQVFGRRML
jgi:hypothetical protein